MNIFKAKEWPIFATSKQFATIQYILIFNTPLYDPALLGDPESSFQIGNNDPYIQNSCECRLKFSSKSSAF